MLISGARTCSSQRNESPRANSGPGEGATKDALEYCTKGLNGRMEGFATLLLTCILVDKDFSYNKPGIIDKVLSSRTLEMNPCW